MAWITVPPVANIGSNNNTDLCAISLTIQKKKNPQIKEEGEEEIEVKDKQ